MTVVRPEVELMVTASDIPEYIEVDVSTLEVGDAVTISSVKLPQGARAIIDRDFVIATVQAPSSLKSSDTEDEDGVETTDIAEEAEEETEAETEE